MKKLFLTSGAVLALATAAPAATLTNGSLDGTVGSSQTPAGWTSENSVDITSTAVQPFTFLTNPGDSPDGGTWAGLASDNFGANGYRESITQTVTDFIVGQVYNVSWYATNTGCCNGTFDDEDSVIFELDGVLSYESDRLAIDGEWHLQSYDFVATATSHVLTFGISAFDRAYMGIDGISLVVADVAPIPLPGAGALLLAGIGGFAYAGRKRKAA